MLHTIECLLVLLSDVASNNTVSTKDGIKFAIKNILYKLHAINLNGYVDCTLPPIQFTTPTLR